MDMLQNIENWEKGVQGARVYFMTHVNLCLTFAQCTPTADKPKE